MSENIDDNVTTILENIKETLVGPNDTGGTPKSDETKNNLKIKTNITRALVKGKPKSGRFWKSERERFTSVNKTKGVKLDFQRKSALRMELKRTKEFARLAAEGLKEKALQKKERRKENIKRAEEKKHKAEVVQVITNTAKLRRMRKKQLRFIEKRDTNKQDAAST